MKHKEPVYNNMNLAEEECIFKRHFVAQCVIYGHHLGP